MKKAVLIVSHLGADGEILGNLLNYNPRVLFIQPNIIYDHIGAVEKLTNYTHKTNNVSAVWLDLVVFNYYFSSKSLYRALKFIYFIRDPKQTLNKIANSKFNTNAVVRYYCYRLQRIYSMAKKTPGSLFLTYDDVITGRSFPMIEKFLGLKEPIILQDFPLVKSNQFVTTQMLEECQRCYERYLFLLKQLPINMFEFQAV